MSRFVIRTARHDDIPVLRELINDSVRGLQTEYTPAQREGALESTFGVDTQLILDGTYFVVEAGGNGAAVNQDDLKPVQIAGCGGWSKRKTLYGGDQHIGRDDGLLDPGVDAAKIRAFYVHPAWARQGIGSLILQACEDAASHHGFRSFEMGSTLTGCKLYQMRGYVPVENLSIPLANGESLPIVRMAKQLN